MLIKNQTKFEGGTGPGYYRPKYEETDININQGEVFRTGITLGYSIGLGILFSLTTTEMINRGLTLTYRGCKKIYELIRLNLVKSDEQNQDD